MKLTYNDTVTLYSTSPTGYGAKRDISESVSVPCIFLQGSGFSRVDNAEFKESEAVVYLDPDNEYLMELNYHLEGMYIKATVFGVDWYKITSVSVNKDHLLSNQIDNVLCSLRRTEALNDSQS